MAIASGWTAFLFAAGGSVAVILANLFLRPLARRVDLRSGLAAEAEVTYEFRAVCHAEDEAHVRALLVQAFSSSAFRGAAEIRAN